MEMFMFKLLLWLAAVQFPLCTSTKKLCDDNVVLPWEGDHKSPFYYVGSGRAENVAYSVMLRYPPAYYKVCGGTQTHRDFVTFFVKPVSVIVRYSRTTSLDDFFKERVHELLSVWPILSMEISNWDGMKQFWIKLYTAFGHSKLKEFSPEEYFETGLLAGEQYGKSLISRLQKHGFSPTNEKAYRPKELVEALAEEIGYHVEIVCIEDPDNDRYYLYGINICFTSNSEQANCYTDKDNKLHYCPETDKLYILQT